MLTRFRCDTCIHVPVCIAWSFELYNINKDDCDWKRWAYWSMYVHWKREREGRREREREREKRDVYQILHFCNKLLDFQRDSSQILSVYRCVCVRVPRLSLLLWEGDGGQMTFQGSYLNRRLRSTNLLLVALLLLVLPVQYLVGTVLSCEATRLKNTALRLLWCWPLHLALISTHKSTGFEQW